MKSNSAFLKKNILVFFLGLTISCSQDDGEIQGNPNGELSTFEEVIAQGASFESFPDSRKTDTLAISEPINEDYERENEGEIITERFICTTKTINVLDGNGNFPLFDTNADVIYPGSLLQGKTLSNATPSPIVVKRAGGTISYNLNNGNLQSSFSVDEVKKSSIQNGMNTIIANSGEVVPANFKLDIIQIDSESQMALEMGIDFKTWTTKVSTDMSFSTEKKFNRTLIKLNQAYYTMSFDLPTSLSEIFDESVTPQQLNTYVQPDNPATFISSVTYGRIFYMLIESTSSRQEMNSKLNIAYGSFGNSASGELEVNAFQSLRDLKIKVIAYGGDAVGSFELTGETTVEAIANKLAESTDIRAGLPLSYVVRSVERPDQIVGTRLATEYDVVECELKGILPPEGYQSIVDLFKDDEDGGGIGAMVQVSKSNVLIFNKMGTTYAWYNGATGSIKGIFSIYDINSPLGEVPLDNVGAATQLSDSRIYFFDKTGLLASRLAYNKNDPQLGTNDSAPTTPIGNFLDPIDQPYIVNSGFGDASNFPFVGDGFEAGVRVGVSTMAFFGRPGAEYALYSTSNGAWDIVQNSTTWFDGNANQNGTLFERVGAATFIEFSDSTGRWLLANAEGNEIMQYQSSPIRTFQGPWVIN